MICVCSTISLGFIRIVDKFENRNGTRRYLICVLHSFDIVSKPELKRTLVIK